MSEKKAQAQEDKICLGVASAIAIALIVLGILSLSKLGGKIEHTAGRNAPPKEMPGKKDAEKSVKMMENQPSWGTAKKGAREISLITSIPLFQIPGEEDLIDIESKESKTSVHPPIPNGWWIEHGIDPSYEDSPLRDHDLDGFTNLEEYEQKTSPSDASEYPELVDKLRIVRNKSNKLSLNFNSSLSDQENRFNLTNEKGKRYPSQYVAIGSNIFTKGDGVDRFSLKLLGKKGIKRTAIITDHKKEIDYELTQGNLSIKKIIEDYTIVFSLKALGKQKDSFELTENTRFDLPEGNVSDSGRYLFKEVRDGKAIVEYNNEGGKIEVAIPLSK